MSTEEQTKRKTPIATQRQVCLEIVERQFQDVKYHMAYFVDEGISGTIGEEGDSKDGRFRPEYTRMLNAITAGQVDWVVVQSLDRLGRDEVDVFRLPELLADKGVPIATPGRAYNLEDPDDMLMFGWHALFAAHQPRQTAIEVRAGKLQRKRRGLVSCSRPPFGWRLQEPGECADQRERTITAVPEQGEVVKEIARLYLGRGWGYDRIAKHLQEQGIPAYGPSGWYGSFIRLILVKEVHAGLVYVQRDEYVKGTHFPERYYDPERFFEIQREMQRRADVRCYSAQGDALLVGPCAVHIADPQWPASSLRLRAITAAPGSR